MGEERDIQAAFLLESFQRGGGLGHLHQGKDSLLHTRAAAGAKNNQGQGCFLGVLDDAGDFFPHRRAHAAHQKPAVQNGQSRRTAADTARPGDSGFKKAGLLGLAFQLFRVSGKRQRIGGYQPPVEFPETAFIHQQVQAGISANWIMVAAARTNVQVLCQSGSGIRRGAGGTRHQGIDLCA